MIVLNIFLVVIFSLATFVTYIKIRYPFWNIQPVLHKYDIWRQWGRNKVYPVYPHCPIKTKYCDFEYVKTTPYLDCSLEDKNNLLNLIQCYYIPTEKIIHTIDTKNIDAYLTGGREPSFISFYNENTYDCSNIIVGDIIMPDIICSQRPIGAITSSFIRLFISLQVIDGGSTSLSPYDFYKEYPLYYIDYLSIHRERDVKKISRKILQTHEYNQRTLNPNITCSLIKKEIELFNGVVPFIEYITTTYHIRNNHFPLLPPHHEIVRVHKENIDLLSDFLHIHTKTEARMFDICVFPEIGTLVELIQQNLLYIYCLRCGEDIYGYYFIKDAKMEYEDLAEPLSAPAKTLHCTTSFMNTRDQRLFYLGFLHILHDIIRLNRDYKMLIFDEIGHNIYLFSHWRKKYTPIFTNSSAYYLYNLIYPRSPMLPERAMIIL